MQRRAVITGASAGIGRETAVTLARDGMQILAIGRQTAALMALASLGTIQPVVADVTSAEGIARISEAVGSEPVDLLLHGAGVFPRARLGSLRAADWQAAWSTNVASRIELTHALRHRLGGGRVLFIGSDAARTPRPGGAAYSVTQAASEMLWRCCVAEFGDEIAFGLAKPGLVATAMLEASLCAPREEFPAGAVYAAMQARGETIAASTVARFFRFLLLQTPPTEFTTTAWDIRDASHHARWLDGPLYLPPQP